MDQFCIDNGVFLDTGLPSLENPSEHTLHCLLDVESCAGSNYRVLIPPEEGETAYTPGWTIEDKTLVLEVARSLGSQELGCTTCKYAGSLADVLDAYLNEPVCTLLISLLLCL